MNLQTIRRMYNDVVAPHYDLDPQDVFRGTVDRAVEQIRNQRLLGEEGPRLKVLDLGMGTGLFLARLIAIAGEQVQAFGLDLAEKMVDHARRKMPDLLAAVDDVANLDAHFQGHSFDLVCTHFLTGYVRMSLLASKIWGRLQEGGYWSFVGGTKAGFPALQAKANSTVLRWICGAGSQQIGDAVINPADLDEVVRTFEACGFEVCALENYEPALVFHNMDEFMVFAYRGGWFTPILEVAGLHKANAILRLFLNWFYFPVQDHPSIAIVLAKKVRH